MRRYLAGLALAGVLCAAPSARAEDKPADSSSSSASSTSSSSSSSSGEASWSVKATGGLLDTGVSHRKQMISLLAWVPWYQDIGIGADFRYTLPIVHDGFIPALNDSFDIEPSVAFWGSPYGGRWYAGFEVLAAVRWTFYIFPRLAAYARLGFGFHWRDYYLYQQYWHHYLTWSAEVGAVFKITDVFHARLEVGASGLRAGIGFAF